MKIVSNTVLGLSMAAGGAIAAVGIGAHPTVIDIQAAPPTPVHVSPPPPSPPPPPPATNYQPSQDYWTGQGSAGGAPGAGAGGAGGGAGGGG